MYKYLDAEFKKLKSKNTLTVEQLHGGKPWVENHKHWNYEAAKRATEVNVISALLSNFRRAVRWLTENGTANLQANSRFDARGWVDPRDADVRRGARCERPVAPDGPWR